MSSRTFFGLRGSEDTAFERRHKEAVFLNVYDLCNLNDFTIALGLGIFHSGIQLFGIEYGYGGHDLPGMTGIFEMMPCNNKGELRQHYRFRERILLGYTNLRGTEVQRIVDRLGRRQFTGRAYHIVSHNCNHFSIKLSNILCGSPIPGWVNRLANLVAHVPFIVHYLTPPHQRRQRQRGGEERPEQCPEQCPECHPERRREQRLEQRLEQRPKHYLEHRPEQRLEQRLEQGPEERPEKRPEQRPEKRPEQRPEQRPERLPERHPERRPAYHPERRPGHRLNHRPERHPEQRLEQRLKHRPEQRLELHPELHPEYRPERRLDRRAECCPCMFAENRAFLMYL